MHTPQHTCTHTGSVRTSRAHHWPDLHCTGGCCPPARAGVSTHAHTRTLGSLWTHASATPALCWARRHAVSKAHAEVRQQQAPQCRLTHRLTGREGEEREESSERPGRDTRASTGRAGEGGCSPVSGEGQPRGEVGTKDQRSWVGSCAAIISSYFSLAGHLDEAPTARGATYTSPPCPPLHLICPQPEFLHCSFQPPDISAFGRRDLWLPNTKSPWRFKFLSLPSEICRLYHSSAGSHVFHPESNNPLS